MSITACIGRRTISTLTLTAVATLLAAASWVGPARAGQFVLVRDGRPAATIVTAAKPTDAAAFSAQELQYHVQQITGAVLPIESDADTVTGAKILVGPSTAAAMLGVKPGEPGDQNYWIRFVDDTLILSGTDSPSSKNVERNTDWSAPAGRRLPPPPMLDDQGTSYAVHDFLERFCDVRWFGPGKVGMVCPRKSTLAVEAQEIHRRPAFLYRQPWGPQSMILDQWDRPSRQEISLFYARLRAGGEKYACNHSLYGYYDRFWKKNPQHPELFEAAHPDWFGQGYTPAELKRYDNRPLQLCYSNADVVRQVAADADSYFEGHGAGVLRRGRRRLLRRGADGRAQLLQVSPMPGPNDPRAKLPGVQQRGGQRLLVRLRQQGGPRGRQDASGQVHRDLGLRPLRLPPAKGAAGAECQRADVPAHAQLVGAGHEEKRSPLLS